VSCFQKNYKVNGTMCARPRQVSLWNATTTDQDFLLWSIYIIRT